MNLMLPPVSFSHLLLRWSLLLDHALPTTTLVTCWVPKLFPAYPAKMNLWNPTSGRFKPWKRERYLKTLCTGRDFSIAIAFLYVSPHIYILPYSPIMRNNTESNNRQIDKVLPTILDPFSWPTSSRISEGWGGVIDGWDALYVLTLFYFILLHEYQSW